MDTGGLPLGIACTRCNQHIATIFTPIAPSSTPLIAACNKCLGEVMEGKPARTAEEWKEVEKKLK
jgi:hypothetical protein